MAENPLKALAGKYTPRFLNEGEEQFIPSGSIVLDEFISGGRGIPLGSFIQVTGDSGIGKTTILLSLCKMACSMGKSVIYIDAESAVNESQLQGMGLSKYVGENFFIYQAFTYEDVEDILDTALEVDNLVYIIIDSITSLMPKAAFEGSIAEVRPGIKAAYASLFLNKYRAKIRLSKSNPSLWIINQMRVKLNFRGMSSYSESGGSAQKFYNDLRISITKNKDLTENVQTMNGKESIQIGSEVNLVCLKNRYYKPFVKAVLAVKFGKGISNILAYKRILLLKGVAKMKGAGFWTISLPGQEPLKARGDAGLEDLIRNNIASIKEYLDSTGGFKLIIEDPEEVKTDSNGRVDLGDE